MKAKNRTVRINTGRSSHSNHNQTHSTGTTVLPLPPTRGEEAHFEMEVYARFMGHLRQVPASRMEIKILSAIQFTADMLGHGDALVAKTLVDMGLLAPRKAFPAAFLEFADKSLARAGWEPGAALTSIVALKSHWDGRSVRRREYAYYTSPSYIHLSTMKERGNLQKFTVIEDV